jgi:hypothetical protein
VLAREQVAAAPYSASWKRGRIRALDGRRARHGDQRFSFDGL